MSTPLERLQARLFDPRESPDWPPVLRRAAQYVYVMGRDLAEGQLSMRSMSLVYTTLLSLVPLLALAFSILKALGVHNSLEPVLYEALAPLGERAEEITASIIGFVENIQVGVLGSLGIALLFYAAISMIQKVEASFNFIWRITDPRPFSQRVGEYLAVLTVGPVLVFSAMGITASLLSNDLVQSLAQIEPFGTLLYALTRALPYLLVIGAFTFAYIFIPNTRVRLLPAFAGGLLGGLLWQTASLGFARFVAGASNYNAIYSGFAIFLFLLIWLYLSWLILLTGCQLAFYLQHPSHVRLQRTAPHLSSRAAEYLGLAIMTLVTRAFIKATTPPSAEELAESLDAAPEHVMRQIQVLRHHGLLATTGPQSNRWLPALDPEQLPMSRLWRLIRAGTEPLSCGKDPLARPVLHLVDAAETPLDATQAQQSLRAFVLAQDTTTAETSPT